MTTFNRHKQPIGRLLLLATFAGTLLAAYPVHAEEAAVHTFLFHVSPGGTLGGGEEAVATLSLGPGFAIRRSDGVGVDLAVGYGSPVESTDNTGTKIVTLSGFGQDGYVYLSLSGTYHFPVRPESGSRTYLLTLGFTRLFGDVSESLLSAGLGQEHALTSHWGLRTELRDAVTRSGGALRHYLELRIGIAYR